MIFIQHDTFKGKTPRLRQRLDRTWRQSTVVVETPSLDQIKKAAWDYISGFRRTLAFSVGRAIVHPNDTFNRKTGCIKAKEKKAIEHFDITSVSTDSDTEGEIKVRMSLRCGDVFIIIMYNPQNGFCRLCIY